MPFQQHELDRIKAAAAQAVADQWVAISLTGTAWGPDAQTVALAVLEAIDQAAEDDADPRPFSPGRKVRVKGTGIPGVVVRTVESDGELHTVIVRLALEEFETEAPFGPRELEAQA